MPTSPASTSPADRSALLARFAILGSALLFSTGGAAIKATQLSGLQIASLRAWVAGLTLFALVPLLNPGVKHARRQFFRTVFSALSNPLGEQRLLLPVAIVYALTMILFVMANKLTTSANTIFLQSTAPLYVLLASPWLLNEAIKRRDLLCLLGIGAGLLLFFVDQTPNATAPNPILGNILALSSGVFWAATLLGLRSLGQRGSTGTAVLILGNFLAAIFCLPFAMLSPDAVSLSQTGLSDWLSLLYLGSIQIGLAYLLLNHGLKRVPALEASLLVLLEPGFNPLWAYWLHQEKPSLASITGGLLILGTSTWHLIGKERSADAAQQEGESPAP